MQTETLPENLKIRPLLVDGKTKEFTVGPAHDVTDRTFVVQRIVRVNDSIPQESGASRWIWQNGGGYWWIEFQRAFGGSRFQSSTHTFACGLVS